MFGPLHSRKEILNLVKECTMLFLLGGEKKKQQAARRVENVDRVRDLFNTGRFPVVTTNALDDNRKVGKVLGLVVCRGYDSDETFFGMAEIGRAHV